MKLIKRLAWVLISFTIVTLLLLAALTYWLSPENIKHFLTRQISAQTGQPSTIDGDIHWQVWPRPALKIARLQLGNRQNPKPYALTINSMLLHIELKPLLQRKVIISDLNIEGYHFIAQTNHLNQSSPTATKSRTTKKTRQELPIEFAINKLLLSNGTVLIKQNKTQIVLKNLQLGVVGFNLHHHAFSFQSKSHLQLRAAKNAVDTEINFKGKVTLPANTWSTTDTFFNHLQLEGPLLLEKLRLNGLRITQLRASTSLNQGTLLLNPLNIALYDGESIGRLELIIPRGLFSIDETASNLNAGKLMQDLLKKPPLNGLLDFSIHAQGNFKNPSWEKNIHANGYITIKKGTLLFVDIQQLLNDLSAKLTILLSKDTIENKILSVLTDFDPKRYESGTTAFELLNVQYTMKHDLKIADKLVLQASHLHLQGQGEIDLAQSTISNDLLLQMDAENKLLLRLQQLFTAGIPIKIQGPLKKPSVYPDINIIRPLLSRYILKKTLDKPLDELKNDLKKIILR